jgi:HAD superfamily hydrolase (TIGR01549 family)
MRSPIGTLLFDFGGTLDADGVAWKERFYAHYRAEGLDMTEETFAPIFYAADDAIAGSLPADAALGETARRLSAGIEARLSGRGAADRSGGARSRRVARRFLAAASAAFARNRGVLQALKERYRLGLVANFYGNLEAVCRDAQLASLFGVIVDSRQIGAAKPDRAIFRAALEPLRATPETALMIGDSLHRDLEGARRMGMGFIWIAPRDRHEAARFGDGTPPGYPAVERLSALTEILL